MLRISPSAVASPRNNLPLYISLMVSELALVYAVWAGTRRSGTTLRALTGGRWNSAMDLGRDLVLGALFWVVLSTIAGAWDRWGPFVSNVRSLSPMLPKTGIEIAAWVLVSLTAGVAEELVFRGYFQRQFEALTQRPLAALAMQAALFGVSHGYQGISACVKITVIGAMFGALALWRRSLRPGMLAHAWTDIASGIFRV